MVQPEGSPAEHVAGGCRYSKGKGRRCGKPTALKADRSGHETASSLSTQALVMLLCHSADIAYPLFRVCVII